MMRKLRMKGPNSSISKDLAPLTVLVVDSDSRALDLAASHIEYRMAGVRVSKAQSHAEAQTCVQACPVDVLVFDYDAAQTVSKRLLNDLTRSFPDLKVVLTGRSSMPVTESENVLGFLRKPYRVDDLIGLIESVRKPDRRYSSSFSNST